MLENLKELVKINSYENKDEVIKWLKNKFSTFCEEIMIIKNKENNNVSFVAGINTKLKDIEPIVLSGHIDTVAPCISEWQFNPLELIIS